MMNENIRKFSPYPCLSVTQEEKTVNLSTPWLALGCEISGSSSINLSGILYELHKYPVCYIHPRNPRFQDVWSTIKNIAEPTKDHVSPSNLVHTIAPKNRFSRSISFSDKFCWDVSKVSKVLEFSRIGNVNLYDSLSAFSVIREHLHEALLASEEKNLFEEFEGIKREKHFASTLAVYIFQNYFITKNCKDSLQPAIQSFPNSAKEIEKYIKMETGHHNFVQNSLKKLGYSNLNELRLFDETRLLMEILRYCAKSNLLAFVVAIEFFEAGTNAEKHPITELLKNTRYSEAGIPLQKHREINLGEGHSVAASNFFRAFDTCSKTKVIEAIHLIELLVTTKKMLIKKCLNELEFGRDNS